MSEGTVFDIQRFSIHDGPGIRTTVFLKGCPLRCAWCQNPEGLDRRIGLWNIGTLCAGCGRCIAVCPEAALRMGENGKPVIDSDRCVCCGTCVEACNRNALALDGYRIGADELAERLLDDRVFFTASGGGITFSGGEPLAQAGFVRDVAARLRNDGVATAVETCLGVSRTELEQVMPVIDLFLVDIKLADPARHQRATGCDNRQIHEAFRHLARTFGQGSEKIRVRVPLIPGFTADQDNLAAIAALVAAVDRSIPVELMNFNPLAAAKYRRMPGTRYPLTEAVPFSDAEMDRFKTMMPGVTVIS